MLGLAILLETKELAIFPQGLGSGANLVTPDWANTFPFVLKGVGLKE